MVNKNSKVIVLIIYFEFNFIKTKRIRLIHLVVLFIRI
jgi:hypothetical protein